MGLFTYVEPAAELLAPEHQNIDEWQTKSVVDPEMETLEITANGELYYIWHSREWRDDPESFFGGFMVAVEEHREKIDFHGDMNFYSGTAELVARFTNGKLEYIKPALKKAFGATP